MIKDFGRFDNRRKLKTYHEVINRCLFFARGDEWRKIRKITTLTFTSAKLKRMYYMVRSILQEYINHLEHVAKKNEPFNAKDMNEKMALDTIALCAFATKTNSIKDPDNPVLIRCHKAVDSKWQYIITFILPGWLLKVLGIKWHVDQASNQYVIDLAKQIINERKTSGVKGNDFLQLLVDARAEDSDHVDKSNHFLNLINL